MPLATQISPIGIVAYDSTPTAEELRDALIELGLMEEAPVTPPVVGDLEFEDREGIEWEDRDDIEFEDR